MLATVMGLVSMSWFGSSVLITLLLAVTLALGAKMWFRKAVGARLSRTPTIESFGDQVSPQASPCSSPSPSPVASPAPFSSPSPFPSPLPSPSPTSFTSDGHGLSSSPSSASSSSSSFTKASISTTPASSPYPNLSAIPSDDGSAVPAVTEEAAALRKARKAKEQAELKAQFVYTTALRYADELTPELFNSLYNSAKYETLKRGSILWRQGDTIRSSNLNLGKDKTKDHWRGFCVIAEGVVGAYVSTPGLIPSHVRGTPDLRGGRRLSGRDEGRADIGSDGEEGQSESTESPDELDMYLSAEGNESDYAPPESVTTSDKAKLGSSHHSSTHMDATTLGSLICTYSRGDALGEGDLLLAGVGPWSVPPSSISPHDYPSSLTRSATIVALTDIAIVELSPTFFHQYTSHHPSIYQSLVSTLLAHSFRLSTQVLGKFFGLYTGTLSAKSLTYSSSTSSSCSSSLSSSSSSSLESTNQNTAPSKVRQVTFAKGGTKGEELYKSTHKTLSTLFHGEKIGALSQYMRTTRVDDTDDIRSASGKMGSDSRIDALCLLTTSTPTTSIPGMPTGQQRGNNQTELTSCSSSSKPTSTSTSTSTSTTTTTTTSTPSSSGLHVSMAAIVDGDDNDTHGDVNNENTRNHMTNGFINVAGHEWPQTRILRYQCGGIVAVPQSSSCGRSLVVIDGSVTRGRSKYAKVPTSDSQTLGVHQSQQQQQSGHPQQMTHQGSTPSSVMPIRSADILPGPDAFGLMTPALIGPGGVVGALESLCDVEYSCYLYATCQKCLDKYVSHRKMKGKMNSTATPNHDHSEIVLVWLDQKDFLLKRPSAFSTSNHSSSSSPSLSPLSLHPCLTLTAALLPLLASSVRDMASVGLKPSRMLAGSPLFKHGDPVTGFMVLGAGRVRVMIGSKVNLQPKSSALITSSTTPASSTKPAQGVNGNGSGKVEDAERPGLRKRAFRAVRKGFSTVKNHIKSRASGFTRRIVGSSSSSGSSGSSSNGGGGKSSSTSDLRTYGSDTETETEFDDGDDTYLDEEDVERVSRRDKRHGHTNASGSIRGMPMEHLTVVKNISITQEVRSAFEEGADLWWAMQAKGRQKERDLSQAALLRRPDEVVLLGAAQGNENEGISGTKRIDGHGATSMGGDDQTFGVNFIKVPEGMTRVSSTDLVVPRPAVGSGVYRRKDGSTVDASAGDGVGEVPFVNEDHVHSSMAVCVRDSVVFHVNRAVFTLITQANHSVAARLARVLASQLASLSRDNILNRQPSISSLPTTVDPSYALAAAAAAQLAKRLPSLPPTTNNGTSATVSNVSVVTGIGSVNPLPTATGRPPGVDASTNTATSTALTLPLTSPPPPPPPSSSSSSSSPSSSTSTSSSSLSSTSSTETTHTTSTISLDPLATTTSLDPSSPPVSQTRLVQELTSMDETNTGLAIPTSPVPDAPLIAEGSVLAPPLRETVETKGGDDGPETFQTLSESYVAEPHGLQLSEDAVQGLPTVSSTHSPHSSLAASSYATHTPSAAPTHTSPPSNASSCLTLALVSSDSYRPIHLTLHLARRLCHALSAHGPTTLLTSSIVAKELGALPVSETKDKRMTDEQYVATIDTLLGTPRGRFRLEALLSSKEKYSKFIVCVCDHTTSLWSRSAVRMADRIFIIGYTTRYGATPSTITTEGILSPTSSSSASSGGGSGAPRVPPISLLQSPLIPGPATMQPSPMAVSAVTSFERSLVWERSALIRTSSGLPIDYTRKDLVLIHHPDTVLPSGTRYWLRARRVHDFHHIRGYLEDFEPRALRTDDIDLDEGDSEGDKHLHHSADLTTPNRHIARLARGIAGRAFALVLSGGGARGLAHVGAVNAMKEFSIPYDFIAGTSQGALVGALLASWPDNPKIADEKTRQLAHILGSLRRLLSDATLPVMSYFAGKGFGESIQTILGSDVRIEDIWLPYFCVSTNVSTADIAIHRFGSLWRAVRSSMTLLEYLPPMNHLGELLIDGGYVNNLPVDAMKEIHQPRCIVAVDVENRNYKHLSNVTPYGDYLDGWWLLWKKLSTWFMSLVRSSRSRHHSHTHSAHSAGKSKSAGNVAGQSPSELKSQPFHVPKFSEIIDALVYINHNKNIRQFIASRVMDLYIRPNVDHIKTLDYHRCDSIVEIGYNTAKPLCQKFREMYYQILPPLSPPTSPRAASTSSEANQSRDTPIKLVKIQP